MQRLVGDAMNRVEPFPKAEDTLIVETYSGDVFIIALQDLPTEGSTLKEYSSWRSKWTPGAIPLTKPWSPQILNHSSIKQWHSLAQYVSVKGSSFHGILKCLIEVGMAFEYHNYIEYLRLYIENLKHEVQEVNDAGTY